MRNKPITFKNIFYPYPINQNKPQNKPIREPISCLPIGLPLFTKKTALVDKF